MAKRSSSFVLTVVGAIVVLLALLVAATPLARAQEPNEPVPNIIGGQPADPGEYPFLVAVVRSSLSNSFLGQFCGGTVISTRWVLTAAHCLTDENTGEIVLSPGSVDIVVGRHNLNCSDIGSGTCPGDRIGVSSIVIHPSWDPAAGRANDVALLELASPTSAPPVALATPAQASLFASQGQATSIGWGSRNQDRDNPDFPLVPHEVDVPIVSDSICQGQYIPGLVVGNQMVCTGIPAGGIGACNGDSGGPLLVADGSGGLLQVGITSFGGSMCAGAQAPDVYAEVAAFQGFLKQIVGSCSGRLITIDMRHGASGVGTNGDDVIYGTPGADTIDGLGGDDAMCGTGGNDTMVGGDGDDTLIGGGGDDLMRGGPGEDVMNGDAGNDRVLGGIGNDDMSGGDGDDYLGGFGGADTIDGGPGNERIFGGFGADTIDGGPGNDVISGLIGNDTINGGAGNDTLNGDRGNDTIAGGTGGDTIRGGNANDVLNGNGGNDDVSGGKGDDRLSGGGGTGDVCSGNKQIFGDFADATCETIFGAVLR